MTYISRAAAIDAYMSRRYGGSDEVLAAINALPAVAVTNVMLDNAVRAYVMAGKRGETDLRAAMRAAIEVALPDAP